jgi:purine-nucleoside phosphorylase
MNRRGAAPSLPADPLATAALLRRLTPLRPKLGIILGSGFQGAACRLHIETTIPCTKLPGFPRPGVQGHKGEILAGRFGQTPVLLLSGRAHFYEGHPMEVVTFPVRVMAAFGVRDLLLTNAAGGINSRFRPGDFMCLSDHINLMGTNPLRGPQVPGRERFIDLSEVYAPELRRLLASAARKARAPLHSGVYLAVSGPSYETPAEIRAFARLGADAVGMSTVPEAIVARQCGLRVAGLSCITNLAAGRAHGALSHEDVLETAARVGQTAAALIEHFVKLHAETQ